MSADSWKLTLPCTRDEAEAIDAADDLAIEAVIMTTEVGNIVAHLPALAGQLANARHDRYPGFRQCPERPRGYRVPVRPSTDSPWATVQPPSEQGVVTPTNLLEPDPCAPFLY